MATLETDKSSPAKLGNKEIPPLSANPADARVISFLLLRRAVGIIGVLLPPVLVAGTLLADTGGIEGSISAYYYTDMRNILVGALCAIAVFLFCYQLTPEDNWVGNVAAIGALGVAFFPTTQQGEETTITSRIHLLSAAVFFLSLATFCFWLFRRPTPNEKSPRSDKPAMQAKYQRVFFVLGLFIIAPLLVSIVLGLLDMSGHLFWTETIAVEAFGVAWLLKGTHSNLTNPVSGPK